MKTKWAALAPGTAPRHHPEAQSPGTSRHAAVQSAPPRMSIEVTIRLVAKA